MKIAKAIGWFLVEWWVITPLRLAWVMFKITFGMAFLMTRMW